MHMMNTNINKQYMSYLQHRSCVFDYYYEIGMLLQIRSLHQAADGIQRYIQLFLPGRWLLLIILFIMDPRPYNYEFRRPRPNNPTYQSFNAYDSLYHMGKRQSSKTNNILRDQYSYRFNLYNPNLPNPYRPTPQEAYSGNTEPAQRQSVRYGQMGVNTDNKPQRSNSNYSQRSNSSASSNHNYQQQGRRASVLASYGSSSLHKKEIIPVTTQKEEINIVFPHNNTSDVFQKQQRPFNIITMHSRHAEPLRKYPKLTRENLLYEHGMNLIGAQ